MAKPNVLVADDDETIVRMVRDFFESQGFCVTSAPDGDVAIKMAMKTLPDVIILDIAMPLIHGLKSLEYLRQMPQTHDIPVIFLTAYQKQGIRAALESIHRVTYLP